MKRTKASRQLANGFRADVLFELGTALERGTLDRRTYAQAVRLAAGYLTSDEFVRALPSVRSTTVAVLGMLPTPVVEEPRTLHRGRMRTAAEIAELERLRQLALDACEGR